MEGLMKTTDERIQAALLGLLKEKRLDEITTVAIAYRSQLNRTTVYRHYVNKSAILKAIEDNVLEKIFTADEKVHQGNVLVLLKAIDERRDIIGILLSDHADSRFNDRFIAFLVERGLNTINSSPRFNWLDDRQKELLMQYLSSSLMGLVKYWLEHPEMPVEELDDFFESLFQKGVDSFTGHRWKKGVEQQKTPVAKD